MSAGREMFRLCHRAGDILGPAAERTCSFVRSLQNADGGFCGRDDRSDLYYSLFAGQVLASLEDHEPLQALADYLDQFACGEELDLVHLSCLARCWAVALKRPVEGEFRNEVVSRIRAHRSGDGGYGLIPGCRQGSAYGCFLAAGTLADLDEPIEQPELLIDFIGSLFLPNGGAINQADLPFAATPSTAAAVVVLAEAGGHPPQQAGDWLRSQLHEDGGFVAAPGAPASDLLSTATALHALGVLGDDTTDLRPACSKFVRERRHDSGGYAASTLDTEPDAEYTWYGLLATGQLG